MELPKLGSLRDRVFREFSVKEARRSVHLANIMALVASTNPRFEAGQESKASEWLTKIKTVFTNYSSAELGIELTQSDTQELEMADAYGRFVKSLRPQLAKDSKHGGLVVTGLDGLFVAHGEKPPTPAASEKEQDVKKPEPTVANTKKLRTNLRPN